MKSLHFNNHISSKQDEKEFAFKVWKAITQEPDGIICISVDDGDGQVWKHTVIVGSELVETIDSITEN